MLKVPSSFAKFNYPLSFVFLKLGVMKLSIPIGPPNKFPKFYIASNDYGLFECKILVNPSDNILLSED